MTSSIAEIGNDYGEEGFVHNRRNSFKMSLLVTPPTSHVEEVEVEELEEGDMSVEDESDDQTPGSSKIVVDFS